MTICVNAGAEAERIRRCSNQSSEDCWPLKIEKEDWGARRQPGQEFQAQHPERRSRILRKPFDRAEGHDWQLSCHEELPKVCRRPLISLTGSAEHRDMAKDQGNAAADIASGTNALGLLRRANFIDDILVGSFAGNKTVNAVCKLRPKQCPFLRLYRPQSLCSCLAGE